MDLSQGRRIMVNDMQDVMDRLQSLQSGMCRRGALGLEPLPYFSIIQKCRIIQKCYLSQTNSNEIVVNKTKFCI